MADNQKTYKATIDVETKGAAKNMDLLEKKLQTSLGEFDNLNEAISKTQDTLGKLDPNSKAFKELSKELQGLKDDLRDTEINSSRFTEALAAQPGVMGLVGQSLEGLRGTFKVFMANPIIAVVAGIAGAFLALRESLTRTEEGQAKLNKISEGFTKIMNGLFAVIEPIAMQLADLVGSLFENEKVMDGLSKTVGVLTGVFTGLFGILKSTGEFIWNTLVTNFKTLIGVAKGAGDVIAGVFTFDWDRIKEGATAAFDAVKEGVKGTVDNVKNLAGGVVDSVVEGFNVGEEQFKKGFQRLTEAEKEGNEKLNEERKKAQEERKKILEDANAILREVELALLDDRTRDLRLREEKYQEDLKALKAAGVTDLTSFEEQYRLDLLAINKKYDDEELAAEKAKQDKIKAEREKAAQEEQERLDKLAQEASDKRQDELAFLQADFELRQQLGALSFQSELDLFDRQRELQREELVANEASASALLAFDKETAAARLQIEQAQQEAKLGIVSNALGTLAQAVGENTAAGKALAIAQATIDTYAGASKALATYPPPFGAIAAGTVIAAGLLNVKKIISTKVPAPPGTTNLQGGAGGATPPQPSAQIAPPQIQGLTAGTGNTGTQIAETIAQSQQRPLRAYVVSQDVSSTQAFDRRVNTAASL